MLRHGKQAAHHLLTSTSSLETRARATRAALSTTPVASAWTGRPAVTPFAAANSWSRSTSTSASTSTAARAATTMAATTERPLQRALVVCKRTRWEHEAETFGLSGADLERELETRGYPVDRIVASHRRHRASVQEILDELARRNIDATVVAPTSFQAAATATAIANTKTDADADDANNPSSRSSRPLTKEDWKNADVMITAGGDGTVLQAALNVPSSELPVVTVNTDPDFSAGHLCAFSLHCSRRGTFARALDLLSLGRYEWLLRKRIRIESLEPFEKETRALPTLALNEVFLSERDASRPTVHQTWVQPVDRSTGMDVDTGVDGACSGPDGYRQRSSGVIVCTGTGSTAWMRSASKVPPADVQRIMDQASQSFALPSLDGHQVVALAEAVNRDCVFPGDAPFVQYCVRESVINSATTTDPNSDVSVDANGRLLCPPRRGFARQVKLLARGWEPHLTLDGLERVVVPYGTIITLSTGDDRVSLRTVLFDTNDLLADPSPPTRRDELNDNDNGGAVSLASSNPRPFIAFKRDPVVSVGSERR